MKKFLKKLWDWNAKWDYELKWGKYAKIFWPCWIGYMAITLGLFCWKMKKIDDTFNLAEQSKMTKKDTRFCEVE